MQLERRGALASLRFQRVGVRRAVIVVQQLSAGKLTDWDALHYTVEHSTERREVL